MACRRTWSACSENAARPAIKDSLKDYFLDTDLYVVDMYQWLWVEDADLDEVDEEFRDEQEDKILKTMRAERKKAQAYQKECDDAGIDINNDIISIDGSSKQPSLT